MCGETTLWPPPSVLMTRKPIPARRGDSPARAYISGTEMGRTRGSDQASSGAHSPSAPNQSQARGNYGRNPTLLIKKPSSKGFQLLSLEGSISSEISVLRSHGSVPAATGSLIS